MISIIKNKKEAQNYIKTTKRLFSMTSISQPSNKLLERLNDIINQIKEKADEVEKIILEDNLISGYSLQSLSQKCGYSVSHLYNIRQRLLKEYAMLIFEVILI